MTQAEKRFNEACVFENPAKLAAAIVVPTGKVTVCDDCAEMEVWHNGKIEKLKVNTCDTYPAVVENGALTEAYALKICAIAETEQGGTYYIRSLAYATDENGEYIGINKDKPELLEETEMTAENMFFINSDVVPVSPFRKVNRYYQGQYNSMGVETKSYFLGNFAFGKYDFDITNWAGARTHFDAGKTAFAQDFTKVLVKYNYKDKASEWVVYDSVALPQLIDIDFSKISYLISNNLTNGPKDESCMAGEDLVFLFGEFDAPECMDVKLNLGEKAKTNADAALYETMRVKFRTADALSDGDAVLTYERDDGAVAEKKFKLTMSGVDTDGAYIFEHRMREVQAWQNTLVGITLTFPEGKYELDYVKLVATGNSSDVKLGKALPMFSDGQYEKGFSIRGMEHGDTPADEYFATTADGDKNREEYEEKARADETIKDKLYPDWQIQPLYTYDYINSCAFFKADGLTYDTNIKERLAAIKKNSPEAYQKCYLDYMLRDDGKAREDGSYIISDLPGAKHVIYKPNQTFTTNDGVERHGAVVEFALNGSKMFKGEPYSKFDKNNNPDGTWRFWPHLLIEQNAGTRPVDFNTEPQYSTGADRMYCEFDVRLKEYSENYTRKVHPDGIERDTGHMSFLLYSYLRPKSNPKTLVWFGLNIAMDNLWVNQYYDVNWCRDSGANTYMYCLAPEAVYSGFDKSLHSLIQKGRKAEGYTKGTKISSDWIHVKVDLSHHIDIILDRVNGEDAYGLGVTTRDDWFFNGVNIGFETSDNVDCTFEMANFNFYSHKIEE